MVSSCHGVPLPGVMQSLTFGFRSNQSLQGVKLLGSLQTLRPLTFGFKFHQSLRSVTVSCRPRTLTFGDHVNQS